MMLALFGIQLLLIDDVGYIWYEAVTDWNDGGHIWYKAVTYKNDVGHIGYKAVTYGNDIGHFWHKPVTSWEILTGTLFPEKHLSSPVEIFVIGRRFARFAPGFVSSWHKVQKT